MPKSLEEIGENILKLIRGKFGILYSNYCLEGPLDEPTFIEMFACYSRGKDPSYYVLGIDKKSLLLKQGPNQIRSKILGYPIREKVFEIQQELIAAWKKLKKVQQEFALDYHAIIAENYGIPLVFIVFGRTKAENIPTAHIYHSQYLPTFICLDLLKTAVKIAIAKGN